MARWMRLPNFSRKDRVEGPMAPEVSMATGWLLLFYNTVYYMVITLL